MRYVVDCFESCMYFKLVPTLYELLKLLLDIFTRNKSINTKKGQLNNQYKNLCFCGYTNPE